MNQANSTQLTGAPQAGFRPTPLAELFPAEDYKFQIRFMRGEPGAFFQPTEAHAELVAQRRRWLRSTPELCAAWLPECEPLLDETIQLAKSAQAFADDPALPARQRLLALGEFWEADFLLLKPGADGAMRLLGGCICFPSSWKLAEKLGHPVDFIHSVVPGLNASLGPAIHTFLAKLKPGIAWQRFNWGLSRSPELNQHPDRGLPRLDATVRLDEVWLRVEDQALVALPKSGGILFGIRIVNHSLVEIQADPAVATAFSRALQTMPDEMARYKNLHTARDSVIRLLEA